MPRAPSDEASWSKQEGDNGDDMIELGISGSKGKDGGKQYMGSSIATVNITGGRTEPLF